MNSYGSSETNLSKSQKLKNPIILFNAKSIRFLTSKASKTFIQLWQVFTKTPIF